MNRSMSPRAPTLFIQRLIKPACYSMSLLFMLPVHAQPLAHSVATQKNTPVVTPQYQPLAREAYEGHVEATKQSQIAAQVSTAVTRIPVNVGDTVQQGQLLIELDPRAAIEQTQAAQATTLANHAQRLAAQQHLQRQQKLYAQGYISAAALEQATANYQAMNAQYQAQQAQQKTSETQLSYYKIRAPYRSIVSAIHVEQGDMATAGTPLITLYDPSQLRVVAHIPASVLAQSQLTPQNTQIEIPERVYQSPTIQAIRLHVLPTVHPSSLTQTVRAYLPPQSSTDLSPGMFARLWIPQVTQKTPRTMAGITQAYPTTLYIPSSSVIRRGELTAVYVLLHQTPQLRQVRVGSDQNGVTPVLSGLKQGERVIRHPERLVR